MINREWHTSREDGRALADCAAALGVADCACVPRLLLRSAPLTRLARLVDAFKSLGWTEACAPVVVKPTTEATVKARMAAIFADATPTLPAHSPESVPCCDEGLDAQQRDAVSRALETPDICLIAGVAGSGKSRVLSAILTQSVARGERVLVVAPGPPPLERLFESLSAQRNHFALRWAHADERLTPPSQEYTPTAWQRHLRERVLSGMQSASASAQRIANELRALQSVRSDLTRALADGSSQQNRLETIDTQLKHLQDAVGAEAEATQTDLRRQIDSALDGVRSATTVLEIQLADAQAEHERVAKLSSALADEEAKAVAALTPARGFRLFNLAWWRGAEPTEDPAIRDVRRKQREQVDADLRQVKSRIVDLKGQRDRYQADGADLRKQIIAATLEQRQSALLAERATIANALRQITGEIERHQRELLPDAGTIDWPAQCAAWQTELTHADSLAASTRECVEAMTETLPTLPTRCLATADVVAATISTVRQDRQFQDLLRQGIAFDRIIFDEAEFLSESDFKSISRFGARCILIGAVPAQESREAPVSLFHHLWQRLHASPRQLPFAWTRTETHLHCRLRPISAAESRWLESEAVADRPEIEIRIFAPPATTPQLAEVIFPATTSASDAKTYLFQELQELPIQALGHSVRWVSEPTRCLLNLDENAPVEAHVAALQPGVTELLGPASDAHCQRSACPTFGLAFDHAAGWARSAAEAWVERHLGLRDLGRTAFLPTAHRMAPALRNVVAHLLGLSGRHAAIDIVPDNFTFIPVPSWHDDRSAELLPEPELDRPGSGAVITAPRVRGARHAMALEIDLSDSRHATLVPTELRNALPRRGLVNLQEARAVARQLEALLCEATAGSSIGLLALYAAQADLLRAVIHQQISSDLLSRAAVHIGSPEDFRQRECDTVLLSLTRSQPSRAVAYGDGPEALTLALTRARSMLLVFGDANTLTRRSQWSACAEFLNASESARERAIVTRLVEYLKTGQALPRLNGRL